MFNKLNISKILVLNDIKIYFRESYLGTLWQSFFLLVQVLAMGPLFASIFSAKSQQEKHCQVLQEYLRKYLAIYIFQKVQCHRVLCLSNVETLAQQSHEDYKGGRG